jgi:hypothetical protein
MLQNFKNKLHISHIFWQFVCIINALLLKHAFFNKDSFKRLESRGVMRPDYKPGCLKTVQPADNEMKVQMLYTKILYLYAIP